MLLIFNRGLLLLNQTELFKQRVSPMLSITSIKSIKRYSICAIREEAINLLELGVISLDQPLRILFEYFPAREWTMIECELERYDYFLRDRIIDLVGEISWESD